MPDTADHRTTQRESRTMNQDLLSLRLGLILVLTAILVSNWMLTH